MENYLNWDSYENAQAYKSFINKYPMYRKLSEELLRFCAPEKKVKIVCDLGCGTGESTKVLIQHLSQLISVYGVDTSDAMLEIARAEPELVNVHFMSINDIFNWKFDMIFASASLWQISQIKLKSLVTNHLVPDGILVYNYPSEVLDHYDYSYLSSLAEFREKICDKASSLEIYKYTYYGTSDEAIAFLNIPIFNNNAPKDLFYHSDFHAEWVMAKVVIS